MTGIEMDWSLKQWKGWVGCRQNVDSPFWTPPHPPPPPPFGPLFGPLLLWLREQQTPAIFFRHLGFTAARYQRGPIARVSQIVKMATQRRFLYPAVFVKTVRGGFSVSRAHTILSFLTSIICTSSSSANKLKTFISKLSHLKRTGSLLESHDKAK